MNSLTDLLFGCIDTDTRGSTLASPAGAQVRADGPLQWGLAGTPERTLRDGNSAREVLCAGAPYSQHDGEHIARLLDQIIDTGGVSTPPLGGEFAFARYQAAERRLVLGTDPFGSLPIYYSRRGGRLNFGTEFQWVAAQARDATGLDAQAIYDYLFYSVVPGGRSILKGICKLPPASLLIWQDGRLQVRRYWNPDFTRESKTPLAEATVAALSNAVGKVAGLDDMGCFLSGGLDSSTVCGFAARHAPRRVSAFTIGFDVPDYDESRYARISASHFDLDLHEHSIRSADVGACLDQVVGAFPEPFGNASALSTYLCARFAREAGVRHLLAGDGGDELFAGNERYQKQSLFNIYAHAPGWLRGALVDPLAALSRHAPGPLRKLASYVDQARVPLPDRLFSYNLLVRNDPLTVCTPDFLASVSTTAPYDYARDVYHQPATGDALDRMLYLDWTLTLTDNDLPKVVRACRLAGVHVHFPMLDPEVVRLSTQVPSRAKVDLRVLRKFYKQAFAGFLPPEVIGKSKHGFGVPVGLWINTDATLRERLQTRLRALGRRGIVQPAFIDELLRLQQSGHAVYYGALMWSLFMLEEWLDSQQL